MVALLSTSIRSVGRSSAPAIRAMSATASRAQHTLPQLPYGYDVSATAGGVGCAWSLRWRGLNEADAGGDVWCGRIDLSGEEA
jgi:hypothetical protein